MKVSLGVPLNSRGTRPSNEVGSMIRDARDEDLTSIVEIYNSSIPGREATADTEPVSVDSRRDWSHHHSPDNHPLWVFEHDGVIAAWFSFEPFYGRPAYAATSEVSVYVASEFHRHGIATALLDQAIQWAPSSGLRTLLGFIFFHNMPSVNLFLKHGFQQWAHLPEVADLDGVRRDLLILGRHVG